MENVPCPTIRHGRFPFVNCNSKTQRKKVIKESLVINEFILYQQIERLKLLPQTIETFPYIDLLYCIFWQISQTETS